MDNIYAQKETQFKDVYVHWKRESDSYSIRPLNRDNVQNL